MIDFSPLENVPIELRQLPQWFVWRYEVRKGKRTKVPIDAKHGSRGQSDNPLTWSTFERALDPNGFADQYEGVGFAFSPDGNEFGIDLDACRNPETGELTPWAQEIVDEFATYTEVSPSGTGVKLVAHGRIPNGKGRAKKLKNVPTFGEKKPEIAIYDRGRFWCMTGRRLQNSPHTCEPRQEQLVALLAKWFPAKELSTVDSSSGQTTRIGKDGRFNQLLANCAAAANGQRSECDFALLAYAVRSRMGRSEAWHRVQSVGKFAEEGERYFNQTWDKAREAAESNTPDIANYEIIETEDEDGEAKKITAPVSMADIIDTIKHRSGDWPRRVDNMLFVDDPEHGLDYFDRRTTAGLFGYLRRGHTVKWAKGGSFVAQAELFAEVERTATRYEAIELLPHEPPISGIYYRGTVPDPGDGSHLRQLLDRFRPETTIDRDLIQAAMMTAFWGGLPGCRPAFVVTSDDGRGVGKSKVPETIGYLCGGYIDVSAGEDIEVLKTRMLTPSTRTKRIAVLDNVKTMRLSWAELESMITSPVISGRQLYVGEGQRPNLLTWFITLNGVSMATDMAQRSVIIKVVRGKNDGPWWEQTRQFIDEHRRQLIGDLIGALRGPTFPLREFSRWATWEQHVLCRLPEPADAQRLILERQGAANCEQDEAEIIEEHFAEQLRRLEYDPDVAQVRIPVATVAWWYGWAIGEKTKTASASKRLSQMAGEGQIKRLSPDKSRTYGRCFVWTGERADVVGQAISNDLTVRLNARDRA